MLSATDTFALRLKGYFRRALFKKKKFPGSKYILPKKFTNHIRIEICGTCNAKCLFCHSGKVPFNKERMISTKLFENILLHLREINLLTKSVYLYDRGEPFMHKEIGKILDTCRKHHVNAWISTNASKVPNLTPRQWKIIRMLKISMSGITEESYKLMYGFNVNHIRKNVEKIARNTSATSDLKVNWLKYEFNKEEEKRAKKWFESLGIAFKPKIANLIQIEKLLDLYEDKLPENEVNEIKNHLLLNEKKNMSLKQVIFNKKKSPTGANVDRLVCSQWDHIIIYDDGELLKCCGLSPYHPENRLGHILDYKTAEEIRQKKYEINHICNRCITYGFPTPTNKKSSEIWTDSSQKI
jgi:MoaA/NifB/PqqE/SkfB family radical SAM enzyme